MARDLPSFPAGVRRGSRALGAGTDRTNTAFAAASGRQVTQMPGNPNSNYVTFAGETVTFGGEPVYK